MSVAPQFIARARNPGANPIMGAVYESVEPQFIARARNLTRPNQPAICIEIRNRPTTQPRHEERFQPD